MTAPTLPPASDDDLPKAFGPWQVVSRLGSGGVGEVYLVKGSEGQEGALKVLRHEGPSSFPRFEREAHTLAMLRHPLIVPVLASDLASDPPYFVMAYVQGRPLKDLIQERYASGTGFSFEEILKVGRCLADALGAAHGQGIYHRDVKPANLLVDRSFDVHLVDFGLARDRATLERLTQEGSFLGTMLYCSPEQFDGSGGEARSDVYQAGLVLYQTATGHLPFDDRPGMAPITMRCHGKPVPPPSHLNPALPDAIETVILRCLQADPSRRYASGSDLLEALGSLPSETAVVSPAAETLPPKKIRSQQPAPLPARPSAPRPPARPSRLAAALALAGKIGFAFFLVVFIVVCLWIIVYLPQTRIPGAP